MKFAIALFISSTVAMAQDLPDLNLALKQFIGTSGCHAVAESDLCRQQSMANFCRNEITKHSDFSRATFNLDDNERNLLLALSGDPRLIALKTYRDVLVRINQQVLQRLAAKGISEQQIRSYLETTRSRFVSEVTSKSQFKNLPALAKAQQQQFVLLSDVLEEGRSDQLFGFYSTCGADGLTPNAASDQMRQVIVCPGILLSVAEHGLNSLGFLLSHELAHSINPVLIQSPNPRTFAVAYSGLEQCLAKNVKPGDLTSVDEFKKTMPEVQAKLSECVLNYVPTGPTVLEEYEDIRNTAAQYNVFVNDFPQQIEIWERGGVNISDAVDSHMDEISADYFGRENLAHEMANIPRGEQETLFYKQFSFLCPQSKKYDLGRDCKLPHSKNMGDEGLHPGDAFRLNFMLSHPAIRQSLGCQSPSTQPYCGL